MQRHSKISSSFFILEFFLPFCFLLLPAISVQSSFTPINTKYHLNQPSNETTQEENTRTREEMLPRSLPSFSSLPSLPSFPSIPSLSSISSNIPSLPYTTSKQKNEVCTLDNSNTALVYNLSTKLLYLYTKTELDLMRLSKAVYCIPIPRFCKKVEVWLPESVDYDYDCDGGEKLVGEIVGERNLMGERDRERDRGDCDEWIYISEAPNDEWISREGNEQRCRVNEWGVREWWRGVVFLPAKVRIERLLGRWGVVFVVEE
jgi:hypothetical protein